MVVGPHHEHPRLLIEHGHPNVVAGQRQRVPGDQDVHLPFGERALVVALEVTGADLGTRVPAPQFTDGRCDDQVLHVADDDLACRRVCAGGERRLARGTQQGLRLEKECLARLGEQRALRRAVEQPDAEPVLKTLDLAAQRWLR